MPVRDLARARPLRGRRGDRRRGGRDSSGADDVASMSEVAAAVGAAFTKELILVSVITLLVGILVGALIGLMK